MVRPFGQHLKHHSKHGLHRKGKRECSHAFQPSRSVLMIPAGVSPSSLASASRGTPAVLQVSASSGSGSYKNNPVEARATQAQVHP